MITSLLNNRSESQSFLWTFPECPLRIHVKFQFIERLEKQVQESASADRELGGLLIGSVVPSTGEIEVFDYVLLHASSESEKKFVVCSESLTRAVQSWSAGRRQVIGFFRTHLEPRIQLRPEDLDCIRSKFSDKTNVFLLLRPHDGRASAGFFFWQDNSVVGGLTFPFAAEELRKPEWNTLMAGSSKESDLQNLIANVRSSGRLGSGIRIGLVALAIILIAVAASWRIYHGRSETSHSLGLRVSRALLGVVVAWDPTSPEIAAAKDADLVIWDGSSPPAFVRLTPNQLRTGRTFFTSISDRVEVRLDVIAAGGEARTQSFVSVAVPTDASIPTRSETAPVARTAPPSPLRIPSPLDKTQSALNNPPAVPPSTPTNPQPAAPQSVLAASTPKNPQSSANNPQPSPPGKPESSLAATPPAKKIEPAQTVQAAPVASHENHPEPASAAAPGSFQSAVPVRERRPEIPAQIRSMIHSDNVVEVQVRINASGKVTEAKLASMKGPVADLLSQAAVSAALGWQFRPATQNGAPVPSEKVLEFLFRSNP